MNDTVKKDNKKSLPRFLLLVFGAALGGGVLGFSGAMFADEGILEAIRTGLIRFLELVSPWGILASGLFLLAPGFWIYRRAAVQFADWDASADEDETGEQIERRLSWALLLANLAMLVDLFFLAASFLCAHPLVNVGVFMVSLVLMTLLQQKVVDLTRRMNPEKEGSVYDTKFRKRWLNSCDEAERAQIGQAAYQAFVVTTTACGVIWVILVMLNVTMGTGLLPVFVVLVIWGVLQTSYILTSIKLGGGSRPGGRPE